jgi:2-phosphosulfolactate phosphatase
VRLDVYFGGAGITSADVAGRTVAVIDVLRASTSITVAMANGARNIIPFESSEEAVLRSKSFERRDVLLAGERKMRPIPGFDLGNSPGEFSRDVVEGKTILFATTNGTVALVGVTGAKEVVVASYANFSLVLSTLRAAARGGSDVTIICAGRDRQFALEDSACAGRYARHLIRRLQGVEVNDATRACMLVARKYGDDISRLFTDSSHGRALADAGYAEDLALCSALDKYPVVPVYQDRQIKLGTTRGR